MSGKGRGQHRKNCLLAFVEDCLNDSSMNHLIRYTDKSKEIFQVLWVHAGRSNYYRKTQGCLFDLYREYRGRGMTSDPKQAFRMALKKSPCIKAVSSPSIQEDWRTFQIVLKCHQNSSDSAECVSGDVEKSKIKIQKPEKSVKMEEPIFEPLTRDSAMKDVEKRINLNQKDISVNNCEKTIANSKIESRDQTNTNLKYQNNYFNYPYLNNIDISHVSDSLMKNNTMNSSINQDNETVCCNNPCCRYSTTPNNISDRVGNTRNMPVVSSPFSQRYASIFPLAVNDPYLLTQTNNQLQDSYASIPIGTQEESEMLAFDSNTYNWTANPKTNINQFSWKTNIPQPCEYSSFQTPLEYDYNNQALNISKGYQSQETDIMASYFKPASDLSQKSSYFVDYNYASEDPEPDIDLPYSKQDIYSKNYLQHYQSSSQQMISCNWM